MLFLVTLQHYTYFFTLHFSLPFTLWHEVKYGAQVQCLIVLHVQKEKKGREQENIVQSNKTKDYYNFSMHERTDKTNTHILYLKKK